MVVVVGDAVVSIIFCLTGEHVGGSGAGSDVNVISALAIAKRAAAKSSDTVVMVVAILASATAAAAAVSGACSFLRGCRCCCLFLQLLQCQSLAVNLASDNVDWVEVWPNPD